MDYTHHRWSKHNKLIHTNPCFVFEREKATNFLHLFYFQLFSGIMTLLKQNAAICIPLGTNALADWVDQGATTLHKLVALFMIFVVQDNPTTANFEPC